MYVDAKILNKKLGNQTKEHFKRIIYHDQVVFIPGMQGWVNIQNSVHVIYDISIEWVKE